MTYHFIDLTRTQIIDPFLIFPDTAETHVGLPNSKGEHGEINTTAIGELKNQAHTKPMLGGLCSIPQTLRESQPTA